MPGWTVHVAYFTPPSIIRYSSSVFHVNDCKHTAVSTEKALLIFFILLAR
jgi:hypothetical protein